GGDHVLAVQPGDVDAAGDADAAAVAARAPLLVPADLLADRFEAGLEPAGVDLPAGDGGLPHLRDGVQQAQVDGVHADLVGELVHRAFERPVDLEAARAPERRRGLLVGVDAPAAAGVAEPAVGGAERDRAVLHLARAGEVVGAVVD